MTTAAKPTLTSAAHYYTREGAPAYEVPYADPRKGMRRTTLSDARKFGLLPSVTTILKCLHREALVNWLIEQACLAVLTSPRKDGEELDAFVERILHTERVQDQESQAARDRGTEIHADLEAAFSGEIVPIERWSWIQPAFDEINKRGRVIGTEAIVVGDGYAGRMDLAQENDNEIWLWDFKTTKKLPNPEKGGAWMEHRLQLAAYAQAWAKGDKPIRTGNVYISTIEQGKFVICEHGDWQETYQEGFKPLMKVWQFINNFS